jgi:hypothetical protein
MASIIRIKRSSTSGNPSTLGAGELAYSALTDNGSNGGDRLYIGMGTETSGNAVNHVVIGGKFFTDMLDHNKGTLTANSAIITDSDSKIDNLLVDNLQLNGSTLSTTNTNGDLNITPNGTGKLVLTNTYIGDTSTTLAEYIQDVSGGAIADSDEIDATYDDGAGTTSLALKTTGVIAGSYGSSTSIPTFTVDSKGRLTAAGTASLATSLGLAADTGTDSIALLTDTLSVIGGEGIDTSVSNNTITISAELATDTNRGVATFNTASFTVTGGDVTIKSGGVTNTQLVNSSVTFGTTTVALGATSTSLAGITELTVDNININGNTISSTDTDGDIVISPNGDGNINASSSRITNVAEPVADSDAATKYYVDAARSGLDVKQSVKVATNANITLSNTQTIDDVALSVGDRVLVKDQTVKSQNGIYVVASGSWTRATDADNNPGGEVTSGMFCFVEQGTVNSDCGFVLTTNDPITLGTTALDFALFSASGTLIAGNGLSKNGYTLEVNVAPLGGIEISADNLQLKSTVAGDGLSITDGVLSVGGTADRITINSNTVDIASTYVGQTSITTLGTINTGVWQGTIVDPIYGGTGVNNGSNTLTLGGNLTTAGAYNTTLTVTANTSLTLPTSGTLATLTGTESLSNKTITSSSFAGSVAATTLSASGLVTFTNTTDAGPLGTAAVVLSGGLSVAKKVYVGTDLIGSGAADSNIDGFNIDGGTY